MTTEKLSDYICQTCGKLIKAVTGHTRKECIDYNIIIAFCIIGIVVFGIPVFRYYFRIKNKD